MTGLRCGHRLRAVQERELAGRSRRTGRVQWGDGLAASAGLDRSGRLAAAARGPVGGTASRGPAGDGRRGHRWLARQGAQGGAHWTFAGRPCPPGQQAPPHRRPAWNPTRSLSDRRKPSRRHPAHAAAGRHPTHPRVTRPATQPPPATTSTSTAASSGLGGSHRRSPAAAPRTVPGWAGPDGSSSEPSPGRISSNDCASATRYAPTSTSHCSNSPAASSA